MGQQQLLLIILGVLIVGAAIAIGLQQFTVGSEMANREAIVNDIANIVGSAQGYYSRPLAMGGGNGSFNNFGVPDRLTETGNGNFTATGNNNQLIVEGKSLIHQRVIVQLTLTRSDDGWNYIWFWEHEGL